MKKYILFFFSFTLFDNTYTMNNNKFSSTTEEVTNTFNLNDKNNSKLLQKLFRNFEKNLIIKNNQSDNKLHRAVRNNNIAKICTLLEEGTDVNNSNNHRETPLHIAVMNQNPEAVLMLCRAGGNPLIQNKNGLSVIDLHKKIENYSIDIAFMLDYNINLIEKAYNKILPLLDLALKKNCTNTQSLIMAKTPNLQVDYYNKDQGILNFIYATTLQVKNVATSHIDKKITTHTAWKNKKKESILHCYCLSKPQEDIKKLLNNYPILCNSRDEEGNTPLLLAIKAKRHDLIPMLCAAGCIITLPEKNTLENIFHLAVKTRDLETIKETIKWCNLFLKNQSQDKTVQALLSEKNLYQHTPLEIALEENLFDIAELLLDNGSSLKQPNYGYKYNKNEQSIFHQVVIENRIKIVKFLLKTGFPVNLYNGNCQLVLDVADENNKELIELLEKYGAKKSKNINLNK